ncbi:sugar ABC transporter ATP-binding protein [Saccharophagus sp. K07]|uniref:sugar ABC transporter ATP-binding protein n=1 Tax=Saccharophagus sp. K07 TaxID=2283636 RepID=UPI001652033A|nr:sugar ABC transporter ATP-binding protein [Saccharophagus sp. K07]MBC6904085.1 sugar ABC transporter ATP-binding protein [Saccharophagus sp. K07]
MTARPAALQLNKICKSFNRVSVLRSVDLELRAGEIHALLGENGAGKSTLIKVMTGAYSADGGEIILGDKTISPQTPSDAQKLGISTVYQEVNLLPNLSVAHNLYLGREPRRFGCIQWKKIRARATELLKRFDLDINVNEPLSSYSIAVQQLVAIARAVDCSAKVLILDEPTASLDAREVALLFRVMRDLRDSGVAILFVTHFLDQVYEVTDRITILRNGERVGTFATNALPRNELVAHMLGKELHALEHLSHHCPPAGREEDVLLEADSVTIANGVEQLNFKARQGDAIGLAGLLGSGRSEICSMLFGLSHVTSGKVSLAGKEFRPNSPAAAIKKGFALCPEDRKTEGIVDPLSVRENLLLALQAQKGWWRPIRAQQQKALVDEAIRALKIVCSDAEKPIGQLSGGNQQKVILARWLMTKPQIFILDEPTRGIDIGAHAEILELIRKLCAEGMTLIVASSEIEELVAFSNKVIIMRDKKMVGMIEGDAITENSVLSAIATPV